MNREIDFSNQKEVTDLNNELYPSIKYVLHDTIRPILYLMYTVSAGQYERIDKNLIQYKAIKIMKRIADNFKETDNIIAAYQIIKIQVGYIKEK